MSPLLLIFALLIGAGFLFFLSLVMLQYKVRKAVKGHLYAHFLPTAGAMYAALCRVDGNVIEAPAQVREKFPKVKTYFIREDKVWSMVYPPGWVPKMFQATVSAAVYYEGNQEPVGRANFPGCNNPIGTPELIGNIFNEKFSRLMLRFGEEFQKLADAVERLPNLKYMLIIVGVTALLGVVNVVLLMQLSGKLSQLLSLYGVR